MPHVNTLPLGQELANIRRSRLLTQAKLASDLGVSLRSIQAWESGNRPSLAHARKLLDWVRWDTEEAA